MSNDDLKQIPLDSIEVVPGFNPRMAFDEAKMAELENSIATNGLFMPLWVQAEGDKYKLVEGERRLRCIKNINAKAKEAGKPPVFERVKATILPAAMTDIDLLTYSFTFGSKGESLTPLEIGRLIYKLKTNFNMQLNEIASKLSMHQSQVSTLLSIYSKADADTIAGLMDGSIKVTTAIKMVREGKGVEGKVIDDEKAVKKEQEKKFMAVVPQWIDWLWELAMSNPNLSEETRKKYKEEEWPVCVFLRSKYEKYLPKDEKVKEEVKDGSEDEPEVKEKKKGRGRPKKLVTPKVEEDEIVIDDEDKDIIVEDGEVVDEDEFEGLEEEVVEDEMENDEEDDVVVEDDEEGKIKLEDIEL